MGSLLRRIWTRVAVSVGYYRGPRYMSELRKLWVRLRNPQADIRFVPDEALPVLKEKIDHQVWGHLFNARHHGVASMEKAARLGLPPERGFVTGHRETYEWFVASPLADAPDKLSDPVWKAGYDFAAEAAALDLL